MTGRRGPGSEEAPVAQPTNVPTPAELVLHETRRAKPLATSAPSCRFASAPRHHRRRAAPEQPRLRERQFQQRRRQICGHTQAWHSQLYHHGTVGVPTPGRRQPAPPWRRWSKPGQTTASHTTMARRRSRTTTTSARAAPTTRATSQPPPARPPHHHVPPPPLAQTQPEQERGQEESTQAAPTGDHRVPAAGRVVGW
jgi:hypothetical protein